MSRKYSSRKDPFVEVAEVGICRYPLAGYAMSVGLEQFKKDQFEGCVSMVYAATATKESGMSTSSHVSYS